MRSIGKTISSAKTPELKSLLLIFVVAIYPLVVIPGPLDYFRGPRYIILTVVSLLSLMFLLHQRINFKETYFIPLTFYIFFILISTIFADDLAMAWVGSNLRFTGLSTYLFCILLFLLAREHHNYRQIIAPMIICAALASIIGIMQYVGFNFIPHEVYPASDTRAYSTFGNVNWFGNYAAFILTGALLYYLKVKNILWLICAALIYGGLLVSLTRGAWLSFAVVFLLLMVILYKQKALKKHFLFLIISFVVMTLLIAPLHEWRLYKRVFSIPEAVSTSADILNESLEGTGSAFERVFIWQKTVQIVTNNWFTGIGPDHLRIIMHNGRIEDKAHNIYLETASTAGVLALLSYLLFLTLILKHQVRKPNIIFFMMTITYLIQGMLTNEVIQIMPLFWIILGLSLAGDQELHFAGINKPPTEESEAKFRITKNKQKSKVFSFIIYVVMLLLILLLLSWYYYPSEDTVEVPGVGIYTGQLRGSYFHGQGGWLAENGVEYSGEFKNGYFNGYGVLSYPDGSEYKGYFQEGYFHGEGTLVTNKGNVLEGRWEKGLLVESKD